MLETHIKVLRRNQIQGNKVLLF